MVMMKMMRIMMTNNNSKNNNNSIIIVIIITFPLPFASGGVHWQDEEQKAYCQSYAVVCYKAE